MPETEYDDPTATTDQLQAARKRRDAAERADAAAEASREQLAEQAEADDAPESKPAKKAAKKAASTPPKGRSTRKQEQA